MTAAVKPTAAHTPGPWTFKDRHNGTQPQEEFPTRIQFGRGGFDTGAVVGCVYIWKHDTDAAKANAARIVACVNACEAFEDPAEAVRLLQVEAAKAYPAERERDALRAEVERLREALQEMVRVWEGPRERAAVGFAAAVVNARAALGGGK